LGSEEGSDEDLAEQRLGAGPARDRILLPVEGGQGDRALADRPLGQEGLLALRKPGRASGQRAGCDLDVTQPSQRRAGAERRKAVQLHRQDVRRKPGHRPAPGGPGADEQGSAGLDEVGDGGPLAGRQAFGGEVVDHQQVEAVEGDRGVDEVGEAKVHYGCRDAAGTNRGKVVERGRVVGEDADQRAGAARAGSALADQDASVLDDPDRDRDAGVLDQVGSKVLRGPVRDDQRALVAGGPCRALLTAVAALDLECPVDVRPRVRDGDRDRHPLLGLDHVAIAEVRGNRQRVGCRLDVQGTEREGEADRKQSQREFRREASAGSHLVPHTARWGKG